MDRPFIFSRDQGTGLLRVVLGAWALLLPLPAAWAQQTVSTVQLPQVAQSTSVPADDDGAKLAQEWWALCKQMDIQKLSPKQRINQTEGWQITNQARLAAQRLKVQSQHTLQQNILSKNQLGMQSAANNAKNLTNDELELASLEDEIRQSVDEMNSYHVNPAERIRMMDEFFDLNKDVLQSVQVLQKKVHAAQSSITGMATLSASANQSQTQTVSPVTQALLTKRDAILNEINTKLNALDQLGPVERIAAVDRDKKFIEERAATLNQIDQQIQSSNK